MEKRELFVADGSKFLEGFKVATYGGHMVYYKRVGSDIYGNPLYRIFPKTMTFKRLKSVYKNYTPNASHDGYWLIQSYNIEVSLIHVLDEMEKVSPLPESWDRSFSRYEQQGFKKVEIYI